MDILVFAFAFVVVVESGHCFTFCKFNHTCYTGNLMKLITFHVTLIICFTISFILYFAFVFIDCFFTTVLYM